MQKSGFQAKTDLAELSQVLAWFDNFTESLLPEITFMQCQILLAEGFTNAVRHAHKNYPSHTPIDIEVVMLPQQIEIRIWDYGQPFDMGQKLESLPARIDTESTGGRGLKLLMLMSGQLSYFRTEDDRNCLLITKQIPGIPN
jgi:serine/threonine-protein kinase RsbW